MDEDYPAGDDTSLVEEDGTLVEKTPGFGQSHNDLVLDTTWWLAAHLSISCVALIANVVFLVTVIYNRKSPDMRTFVNAVIICVAVLDILDVLRVLPVLVEAVFGEEIFRHVYCTMGIFHEFAVALFIVAINIAVCVQAGKESKYSNNPRASVAQKIVIPLILFLASGAAVPFFLIPYDKLAHTCTDPFKVMDVTDVQSENFTANLYSTVVTVFTYVLPLLVVPIAMPIASVRTCISRQCCIARYKQPIGELIMTTFVSLIYIATIVGVILPTIGKLIKLEEVQYGPAPLLWELGNNAARPLCYFLMNPAVWEGLKALCCSRRKKHQLVNDEDEETELALAPVTTV